MFISILVEIISKEDWPLGILFCPLLIRGSSTYFGRQNPTHDLITNLHWQLFSQVSVFGLAYFQVRKKMVLIKKAGFITIL